MNFPVFSQLARNFWFPFFIDSKNSETSSHLTLRSSGESANFQFLARCDCDGETRFIALAYGKFESSSLQQTVRLSRDFSLRYRKAGSCRGVRGPG